jgi:very-short-patch-repair endonuclease
MTKKNSNKEVESGSSDNSLSMNKLASGGAVHMPITKAAQYVGGSASTIFTQPMFFSPLHTPQNWQIASKRREVAQWARFYYENEPKAAAGIDFYANFPMNGFKLECKDRKVLAFYEHLIDKLDLENWLRKISHEYYLLGDVFVFTEVECPVCGGTGERVDGMMCNHPDGVIKRILILNPDFVEVQRTQLADEPAVVLLPDDDLKRVVSQKKPLEVYNRIPENVKRMVMAGAPSPLSPRCVSHIKRKGSPYGTYGESLLRRLFTIISYKTKLMTANWIAAERHILPVRVVKVGTENRPASEADIADAQSQLASVANDPNLTIVTHHAFEMDFVGATGKIHDMSTQMEAIGKEMLDGLMLPQTLLNGEMAGYSSAAVGVETLIRRLETWRIELASWVEKNIFLPVAQMQGFVDVSKSKLVGETVYLYPRLKWNDLNLRDNTSKLQNLMQLHDKGLISTQKLLEEFNIDYDTEINRLREEQITAGKGGNIMGGSGSGGGSSAGTEMPMPTGGSGPPLDMGSPLPPPDMGAPSGGAMPSMDSSVSAPSLTGEAAPMPAAEGGALQSSAAVMPDKIYKKGKAPKIEKKEEHKPEPPKQIYLTKPEQKLYSILSRMRVPYRLFAQFKQATPYSTSPYLLDFAYPEIGVDLEADGDFWHSDPESIDRDKNRDANLATMGWRVIRIKESALNGAVDEVEKIISANIREAALEKKQLSKKASIHNFSMIDSEFCTIYLPSGEIDDKDRS